MTDPVSLISVLLIFMLAGVVKGVIGLGMPTLSLALLSMLFDLPTAMAILLIPTLTSNLWQGFSGAGTGLLARRLWPFLTVATLSVWIGALALTRIEPAVLCAILGLVLVFYALIGLAGPDVSIRQSHQHWSGVICGLANGIVAGMWIGERLIRRRLPEHQFRALFHISLLLLGFALSLRSVSL